MTKRPSDPALPVVRAAFRTRRVRRRVRRGRRRTSRARVLPLALAGLAALGPPGAFAADGESSDGAGVALPLDRSLVTLLAGEAAVEPRRLATGVVTLFLPRRGAERARPGPRGGHLPRDRPGDRRLAGRAVRRRGARRRGRRLAAGLRAGHRRAPVPWRRRPPPALGRRLRAPAGRRSPPARAAARAAGGVLAELAVPSASARTIVYKGLVTGGRLPDLYPDLRAPLARLRGLPPALCHQHAPGLAARPAVPLDRPQRRDQHGPRQSRAGPRPGRRPRRPPDRRRLLAAGPLLSAGRLRFAVARRGTRAPDLDRLGSRPPPC